jgi:uroporphyrinogen decarboxylase
MERAIMGIREKFFRAMRRQDSRYVPFEFGLCPALQKKFEEMAGTSDYVGYYGFPVRSASPRCKISEDRFSKYFPGKAGTEGFHINPEWGMGAAAGSVAHFSHMEPSMGGFTRMEEFESYPFPDPVKDYDWEHFQPTVDGIKQRDAIAVAPMETTLFEISWYMRGMENFMMDMIENPEIAVFLLDKACEIRCESARRYALAGCDVLRLGDDVSTQLDMMMSPEQYRSLLKPRLAKVIKAAKDAKPDMLIFYHGDGNLQKIIPDLIEAGVEILNPIQPECMDPAEIKRKYGSRLSFWGTLGTQTTMPFGSPQDVRRECMKRIEDIGHDGGLFLAPSHILEPEVPWENVEAFVAAVSDYNGRS